MIRLVRRTFLSRNPLGYGYIKAGSTARIGESAGANADQIGSRYAVFLTNIYGDITTKQKNIDDGVTCMIYLRYQDRFLKR
jgi:hypothetical protein